MFLTTPATKLSGRPLFIVGGAGSGLAVLFELLSEADNVYTLDAASRRRLATLLATHAAGASDITALRRCLTNGAHDGAGRKPRGCDARILAGALTHGRYVPLLSQAFPEAQFIYLHRDAAGQIAALEAADASGEVTLDVSDAAGLAVCADYGRAHRAALRWLCDTTQLLDDLESLPKQRFCAVQYADILQHTEQQLSTLGAFAQLVWLTPPGQGTVFLRHAQGLHHAPVAPAAWTLALALRAEKMARLHAPHRALDVQDDALSESGLLTRLGKVAIGSRLRVGLCVGMAAMPLAARADTYVVQNANDAGPASLRDAVSQAAGDANAIITFDNVVGPILLTSGQIAVTSSLQIQGPGALDLTIDANSQSRVFYPIRKPM